LGGGMNAVFGFDQAVPSRSHQALAFGPAAVQLVGLTDTLETSLRLADPKRPRALGVYAYTAPAERPLATYEDSSAAITQRTIGAGHAYALGIDVGALALLGYNHRDEWVARSFVNGFEPTVDVFLRLLKALYRQGEPAGVTLATVPNGKALMVSLTHDIDYTYSFPHALIYAQYEHAQGIRATYFIQAKYIRDYNDSVYFTPHTVAILHSLDSLGMELGSHTVAHSRVFNTFPLGTGTEQYPTYQPFVEDSTTTYNGTILGELRVSKFLVERFSSATVVSFRPGGLSNPFRLPETLEATGYRFSSSTTANSSLTHLPFQLDYGRGPDAETDVFEFPITIEDEKPPKMGERLPQAIALANTLRAYGGAFVILIHPNILDHKLAFEEGFVPAVRSFAWFGSIGDCGRWWAARNGVEVDATGGEAPTVALDAPAGIDGLTLEVPPSWTYVGSDPPGLAAEQTGSRLVLGALPRWSRLSFRIGMGRD